MLLNLPLVCFFPLVFLFVSCLCTNERYVPNELCTCYCFHFKGIVYYSQRVLRVSEKLFIAHSVVSGDLLNPQCRY